jgi:predicted nucleic acid-binding protein
MRIVVDTNVLVSGLLSPFGPPGVIVSLTAAGRLSLCYDARILAEYAEGPAPTGVSVRWGRRNRAHVAD